MGEGEGGEKKPARKGRPKGYQHDPVALFLLYWIRGSFSRETETREKNTVRKEREGETMGLKGGSKTGLMFFGGCRAPRSHLFCYRNVTVTPN